MSRALARVVVVAAVAAGSLCGPASSRPEPPKPCGRFEATRLVQSFVRAFGGGDLRRLDRLFAREPDFRWYSTDGPGQRLGGTAYDRSTLVRYFALRHARGERLRLRSFRFNGNSAVAFDPYGNFEYGLVRQADDLAPTRYYGKGAARCYRLRPDVIFVWSMGRE